MKTRYQVISPRAPPYRRNWAGDDPRRVKSPLIRMDGRNCRYTMSRPRPAGRLTYLPLSRPMNRRRHGANVSQVPESYNDG